MHKPTMWCDTLEMADYAYLAEQDKQEQWRPTIDGRPNGRGKLS